MTPKLVLLFSLASILWLELALEVSAGSLLYDNCGSSAQIVDLKASGCEGTHCTVYRGTTITVEIDFVPTVPSNTLRAEVFGIIAGVPNPFPPVPANACTSLVLDSCPLNAGVQYNYVVDVDVLEFYPTLDVTVLWKLYGDDESNPVACVQISDVTIA